MSEPNQLEAVSARMRQDWNERAREDAHYYVAFGSRDQDEEGFLATAADLVQLIEAELKRFPKNANRRAWRALEIGCGPGRLMKPLAHNFGEIHGVDVSDEMIRLARERLRAIPHAHVHTTSGTGLPQFADQSFDFVYSHAVFQHIPSRDVVLEYLRETRRVLKPGGIFHGQFNGLAHSAAPDTWRGVVFSDDEIRTFTRENGFQLLNLEGVETPYMRTTWRKKPVPATVQPGLVPSILRVTNGRSYEPVTTNRGRHAAVLLWVGNLPEEAELNNIDVRIDGASGLPFYVSAPLFDGIHQINVWMPPGARTGLLPVELRMNGSLLCPPTVARVVPAGPVVPRIVSVTDSVNLVANNRCTSGVLKVQMEEVDQPESVTAGLGGRPMERLNITCIDRRAPRYEFDLEVPPGMAKGLHNLEVRVGHRRMPLISLETA
jgi:SAM-dependent methyltransferase